MTASKMPMVPLGKSSTKVQQLGFGTMGLSAFYGAPAPDEDRLKFLDYVYSQGELFWDSSDMYNDSEDLLGKWFKRSGKRNDIFLATKFAIQWLPEGGMKIRNDPEYIQEACAKSLKRLGTDYIDLYYCHRIQQDQPIEIAVKAMAQLKREGKVRHLGLSECSADTLRRACSVEHIDAVQLEFSPFTMDIENPQVALLKTCRELGVSVVAYSPLGRGFLAGRFQNAQDIPDDDFRKNMPRFRPENFGKNLELVDSLNTLSKRKGCTAGQLTLAWLMAQGQDIIPIPGTTSAKNFQENIGTLDVKLTKEEEAQIRDAVKSANIEGTRYAEGMMSSLFADTPPLQ